jgi:tagatose 6-phosphate kinase
MILTITLNPAVDISYQVPHFQPNVSNRSSLTLKTAGGKGLNVTRVLHCLDLPVKATGFLGGTNGLFIQKELDRSKIQQDFVPIEGDTRNCIAIIHDSNQTEVLEEGPVVSETEYQRFLEKVEELLPEVSVVVASGSLPAGIPKTFYRELAQLTRRYQKPFLLDTSGEALEKALEACPTFIKPNLSEFGALIGARLETEEDIVEALTTFAFPIPYVMLTLGEKGAMVKQADRIYRVSIPKVTAVNPVGSGDATVAGFAAGLLQGLEHDQLFSYSTVMGLLNAMETKTGFVNPSLVTRYMKKIKVTAIN